MKRFMDTLTVNKISAIVKIYAISRKIVSEERDSSVMNPRLFQIE